MTLPAETLPGFRADGGTHFFSTGDFNLRAREAALPRPLEQKKGAPSAQSSFTATIVSWISVSTPFGSMPVQIFWLGRWSQTLGPNPL